jgi:hypothetical protein
VQLADLGDLEIPYARFGVTALGGFLKSRPDTARKVMEAFVEGIYHCCPDVGQFEICNCLI